MKRSLILLLILSLFVPVLFLGCEGDDGATGATGATGPTGPTGPAGPGSLAKAESCSICHGGNPERDGDGHQAIYDMYKDASNFAVTIDDVVSVDNGTVGFYNVTITFTIEQNDTPLTLAEVQALNQKTFYTTRYDGTTMQFFDSKSASASGSSSTLAATGTPGQFTVQAKGVAFAPELDEDAIMYMYVANGLLDTEAEGRGHYHLYNNVLNVGQAFGDVSYVSAANVSGCEKCHGTPYMKHGYRAATVTGLPDFAACKTCHYDDRTGGHQSWQLLVDNPARYAELHDLAKAAAAAKDTNHDSVEENMTAAEKTQYAYTANVMNDVHMSHAMEFPYPQSMSNCATCHEGKLNTLLTDANFTFETCKSCHAVTGTGSETQAPALATIWAEKNVTFHGSLGPTATCADVSACHQTGGAGKSFSAIHTGYDTQIYADAAGTRYSSAITVSIDNATLVGTDLTIGISASGAAGGFSSDNVVPAVLIGLYGYDTKDFIVNGHDRWDSNCSGGPPRRNDPAGPPGHDQPIGEYIVGEELESCPNPYWTLESESPGAWTITAHLATWSGMIDNGIIKRVEIGVMPELEDAEGELVPLNAVSRTFVLATGAFDDSFFGHNIVDVGKCNACHDQLATTFHSGDRGGSVTVCRMCHVGLAGGSHLEMQSRSIDSYVHAIHSFQPFDIGDIVFTDPVKSMRYDLHIEHTYPNFTIMNCESCHKAGTYNVPDQSKSLPSVLSASDRRVSGAYAPVIFEDGLPRNIGNVPSYIVGPAARACGACHRAHAINEDEAGDLASLFGHWGSFGSLVEAGAPPNDIFTVIDQLFSP